MSDADEAEERERIRERKRDELLRQATGEGAGGSDSADRSPETTPDEPVHVDGPDHLQELVDRYGVVLVDYFAEWCGPCKMLEPVLAQVARDTPAVVAKVDIDQHQGMASRAGVRGVPTLALYAGGEQVQQLVGMQDEGTLRDLIDRYA